MRRVEINQNRLRLLSVNFLKIKDELMDAKKQVEKLTMALAHEVSNREVAEVKVTSVDESLARKIVVMEGLEAKLAKAESD
jgi:hypothetical protein